MKGIGLRDHIKHLRFQVLAMVVAGGFVYYMIHSFGMQDLPSYLNKGLVIIGASLLPTLVLHINYGCINGRDCIDVRDDQILFDKRGETHAIYLDEIVGIRCYMTYNLANNSLPALPWDDYHFFVVQTNTSYFIITSLLYPRLHERLKIERDKIVIVKDWFPITSIFSPNQGLRS